MTLHAATESRQAVTLAALALRETLTLADSLGLTPGWTDEATLMLHWRRLTGQIGQTGKRMRSARHAALPALPFGRPLVAVGVCSNLGGLRLPGYLLVNHRALERATWRQLEPIYEAIAAVTVAINHACRFTTSFAEASAEGRENLRDPLSQVVVLARGGRFYLEPLRESIRDLLS